MEEAKFPPLLADTPENRQRTAKRVVEFLDRTGFFEFASDTKKKEKYIKELTAAEAESILERLNGLIVGTPSKKREIYTYTGQVKATVDGAKKTVYYPPHPNIQKVSLEKFVLPAIKKLPLEEAAVLAALEINLLHMFQDGNGRLARLVFLLMLPDKELVNNQESQELIEGYLSTRQGTLNFSPTLIGDELHTEVFKFTLSKDPKVFKVVSCSFLSKDPEINPYDPGIDFNRKARAALAHFLEEDYNDTVLGLREFLFKEKISSVDDYLTTQPDGSLEINAEKVVGEIHTWEGLNKLIEYLSLTKTIRIRIAANIFLNPGKYKSPVPGQNLKDYFIERAFQEIEK